MIVGLLCLMIPDVVGRCNPLEILKGFDFLMSKYYWEDSDIEEVYEKNLYERSISQVLCKGIRQESHLTQNIEVLRQKICQHTQSCGQKYRFEVGVCDAMSKHWLLRNRVQQ